MSAHKSAHAGPLQYQSFLNQTYVPRSKDPAETLDLYVPDGASSKRYPLIIWVHGGGWSQGDKSNPPFLQDFLNDGFAVASIDYRLVPQVVFPAQIYDLKAAVRWLRANANKYRLDPSRFGALGHSAGGHLVALLGASNSVVQLEGNLGNPQQSSYVQAVCDASGPTNFFSLNQPDGPSGEVLTRPGKFRYPSHCASVRMLGATPDRRSDIAKLASPVCQINRTTPPFLIVHGAKDELVPLRQAEDLQQTLKDWNIPSTLMILPEGTHDAIGPPNVRPAVIKFFQCTLKAQK